MPRPTDSGQRYVPGLDGIRALAVGAVIAYHLGVPGTQGGMLGVGVFFTLSGYLITDILLTHWRRNGSLGLGRFWLRRARRLLPALALVLFAVSIWVALFDAGQLADVRRQVLASIVYVSNWSTIAQHGSYFSRFAAPLPLDHLWSLSIEEQFYLVWPGLLLAGIWIARGRPALALLTLGLAALSALAMGHQYHPGYDPTRAYEGTDTRAFGLLIGAAVAIVWPSGRIPRAARLPGTRKLLDWLGVAGLVAIFVLVAQTTPFSRFLYPWGFLVLSVGTAAVVAAVVNPASRLGAVLGWGPLRWVGVRSYGIYLWQWPIIVLASQGHSGFNAGRALLELGGTLLIASLSWRYVEAPIRDGGLGRLWARIRRRAAPLSTPRRVLAASSAVACALCLPALGLSGLLPVASSGRPGVAVSASILKQARAVVPPVSIADLPPDPDATEARALPTRTSCRSVVYIGDSTSEGETSTDYIPNSGQRLPAQLADVGVKESIPEISGARSIVELYRGIPNAATVARDEVAAGFRGCWILALGTNEAADVAVGSNVGLEGRIATMMRIIGAEPVLWMEAVTLVRSGAYAESGMLQWDKDLMADCARYPNLRVFDWPAYAQARWFIPDGIHYYSPGYVARAHFISQGLAHAFPAHSLRSPSCVVS